MSSFIVLRSEDNVAVALKPIAAGTTLDINGGLVMKENVPAGHKFSTRDIENGGMVLKYGTPIGHAIAAIPTGSWVHVHNVKTNLAGEEEYQYKPTGPSGARVADIPTFDGFRRSSGKAGIRNEVWVIPTVGCVNWLVERLARDANAIRPDGVELVVAFPHPFGCSQLGEDHENTRIILANLARHPNAGAVLFIGLGCENNIMKDFKTLVESHPDRSPHIRYMIAQEELDEYEAGMTIMRDLMQTASKAKREKIPVSELIVGMKCGASDGLSGVTANPLLGGFSDWLVDRGGCSVLTEVPEMFGAERSLLNRAVDQNVFQRGVDMVNDFKKYFIRYDQTIYENPSPGNKEGGITTLEDKSIGCTQKGGTRPVVDVIPYGGMVTKKGVTLLSGPGNDIVSVSVMAAAGAHMVLFSTGRGNPLGSPVPVVKVSSNHDLATRKPHWIDFDASPLASGTPMDQLVEQFAALILATASGQQTKSEIHGFHDFTIFKDGVTL